MFLHEATKKKKHDVLNTIQVIMVTVGSSKEKMTKMSMLVIQVLKFTTPKNKLRCLSFWFYKLCKFKNYHNERDTCHRGFKACNTKENQDDKFHSLSWFYRLNNRKNTMMTSAICYHGFKACNT